MKRTAKFCPLCKAKLVTRWRKDQQHSRRGFVDVWNPRRVCLECQIIVVIHQPPFKKPLYKTKGPVKEPQFEAKRRRVR